jgi:hypothetical protein
VSPSASSIPARLLAKIEKLMALSGSPNEHEAASAVSKAQQLLFAHHLAVEDLPRLRGTRTSRDGRIVEVRYGELVGDRPALWQRTLADAVAKSSFCAMINQRRWQPAPGGGIVEVHNLLLIGRPSDVELARRTLDFLTEALVRLANAFVIDLANRQGAAPRRRATPARTAYTAYLDGAADSVARRLLASFATRAQETHRSAALVERREDELAAYLADRTGVKSPPPTERRDKADPDEEAYFAGWADGSALPLSAPVPSLASGTPTE